MKLIIQIPCYNEADTLPATLAKFPTKIAGITTIETMIIDDGSKDNTIAIAQQLGVDHIIQNSGNRGLAYTFQRGLESALHLGADIVVNTDGDNQYPAHYIPDLVQPIIQKQADIVIGDRQIDSNPHFDPLKKQLQKLGSWVVRAVSNTTVPDAASGFRAYSREAALHLNILSHFSYTLETIIQAGKSGLRITHIPIKTNPPTRPSRLQRHMWHFIKAQATTILRVYAFYEPLKTFTYVALPFLGIGSILLLRYLYYYARDLSGPFRNTQSVTIGTGFLLLGFFIFLFGLQADIASKHRQLTQETLYRLRRLEMKLNERERS